MTSMDDDDDALGWARGAAAAASKHIHVTCVLTHLELRNLLLHGCSICLR